MKLEIAERIAAGLVEKLAPFCIERCEAGFDSEATCPHVIAVAGSIRRRRPVVNDIDLVAIPKLANVKAGLFDEGPEDAHHSGLAVALCSILAPKKVHARGPKIISVQFAFDGLRPEPYGSGLRNEIPAAEFAAGVRVDLYLATAETWATTLLIRTGSAQHNIWLAQRARELGGRLSAAADDGCGLYLPDPAEYDHVRQCAGPLRRVASASEDEVLAALCFGAAPPPAQRECTPIGGKPIWANPPYSRVKVTAQSSGGSK